MVKKRGRPKKEKKDWDNLKNFRAGNFACQCGYCGGVLTLDLDIAIKLDKIVDNLPGPLIIDSGSRCVKHNREMGKDPMSPHVALGQPSTAVNVRCVNAHQAFEFVRQAVDNFNIIGISEKYIHVESADNISKPQLFWIRRD